MEVQNTENMKVIYRSPHLHFASMLRKTTLNLMFNFMYNSKQLKVLDRIAYLSFMACHFKKILMLQWMAKPKDKSGGS
jgi:hypothetical protein